MNVTSVTHHVYSKIILFCLKRWRWNKNVFYRKSEDLCSKINALFKEDQKCTLDNGHLNTVFVAGLSFYPQYRAVYQPSTWPPQPRDHQRWRPRPCPRCPPGQYCVAGCGCRGISSLLDSLITPFVPAHKWWQIFFRTSKYFSDEQFHVAGQRK